MAKALCPICGYKERGNFVPSRLKYCSRCTIQRVIAWDQSQKEATKEKPIIPTTIKSKRRTRPCEKCGEVFFKKSNRQRFCPNCQSLNRRVNVLEAVNRFKKSTVNTLEPLQDIDIV